MIQQNVLSKGPFLTKAEESTTDTTV